MREGINTHTGNMTSYRQKKKKAALALEIKMIFQTNQHVQEQRYNYQDLSLIEL